MVKNEGNCDGVLWKDGFINAGRYPLDLMLGLDVLI